MCWGVEWGGVAFCADACEGGSGGGDVGLALIVNARVGVHVGEWVLIGVVECKWVLCTPWLLSLLLSLQVHGKVYDYCNNEHENTNTYTLVHAHTHTLTHTHTHAHAHARAHTHRVLLALSP